MDGPTSATTELINPHLDELLRANFDSRDVLLVHADWQRSDQRGELIRLQLEAEAAPPRPPPVTRWRADSPPAPPSAQALATALLDRHWTRWFGDLPMLPAPWLQSLGSAVISLSAGQAIEELIRPEAAGLGHRLTVRGPEAEMRNCRAALRVALMCIYLSSVSHYAERKCEKQSHTRCEYECSERAQISSHKEIYES